MTKINKLDMPSREEVNEVVNVIQEMLGHAKETEIKSGQVKAMIHHLESGVKIYGTKRHDQYEILGRIAVQARLLSIQADTLADIAEEERSK